MIPVRYNPHTHPAYRYSVAAASMEDLAKLLGVHPDQLGPITEVLDDELARQERLREENRRLNTPEARRRRADFDPFDPYAE